MVESKGDLQKAKKLGFIRFKFKSNPLPGTNRFVTVDDLIKVLNAGKNFD